MSKKINFYSIAHILETIVESQLLRVEKFMLEKVDEIKNDIHKTYNENNNIKILTSIVKSDVNELVKRIGENEEINNIIN